MRKVGLKIDDENNKKWCEYPLHLILTNKDTEIKIRVNANLLDEGHVYFTQINAYDLDDPKMTCLFKIPITVVKPITFDPFKKSIHNYQLKFKDVRICKTNFIRQIFRVPNGATHLNLTGKLKNPNGDEIVKIESNLGLNLYLDAKENEYSSIAEVQVLFLKN